MPVNLKVKNFQSIPEAEIEITGFTVITGPNNTGKTALVRAFQGAFTNTPGHRFVRHGEDKSEVTVSFDDGHTVIWEKGEKISPKYTVDGKEYKPGRAVPEEVQALGIHPIKIADKTFWPQIATQFGGRVFLLDQPGTVLAEAVADVERVGALNKALRLSEKERKAAASKLKVRRVDKKSLTEDLKTFEGLDDLEAEVEALEALRERIEKGIEVESKMSALLGRMERAEETVVALSGIEDVEVPDAAGAQEAYKELGVALGLEARLTKAEALVEALTPLGEVDLPETTGIREAYRQLQGVEDLQRRYREATSQVDLYGAVGGVDLEVLGDTLKAAVTQFKELREVVHLQVRGQEQVAEVRTAHTELQGLNAALLEAGEEVERILGDMQMCPTCGSIIEEDEEC